MELIPGTLVANRYRAIGSIDGPDTILAVDHLLGRYVDLLMAPAPAHTPVGALFARRVAVVADLRHPALPLIYDVVTHDGYAIVVSQHLDGPTLAHTLVTSPAPWTIARALRVVTTLADALGLAHAYGLCHGALRADSIVLGAGSTVFIGDLVRPRLDAARSLDDAAPEIRAGEAPTPCTDVFLLGMLLWRLVEGPGAGSTMSPGLTLPRGLQEIVHRAVASTPGARFPSGATLAQALHAISSDTTHVQHTIVLPVLPARQRGRAHRLLAPVAITAALALWTIREPAQVARLVTALPLHQHLPRAWRMLLDLAEPTPPVTRVPRTSHSAPLTIRVPTPTAGIGTSSTALPTAPPTVPPTAPPTNSDAHAATGAGHSIWPRPHRHHGPPDSGGPPGGGP